MIKRFTRLLCRLSSTVSAHDFLESRGIIDAWGIHDLERMRYDSLLMFNVYHEAFKSRAKTWMSQHHFKALTLLYRHRDDML